MKKYIYLTLLLPILFINSCKTDFDVNANWKDIPVVYCLLNPNDTIHYVKLNKAFLGEEDAYLMAAEPDSLFYSSAEVKLERFKNGLLQETIIFEPTTEIPKEDGIFANDYNLIYKSAANLNKDGEYHLKINIPEKTEEISSTTKLITNLQVSNPVTYRKINFANTTSQFLAEWKSSENARLYEITVFFYYYEIKPGQDPELKTIEWVQPTKTSSNNLGGEEMKQEINGGSFLNYLYNQITNESDWDNPEIQRVVRKRAFDFRFLMGGEELNTFIEVTRPSNGIVQEKPAYTNINNGIGVFSCRFDYTVADLEIAQMTIDSLNAGVITKNLGFMTNSNTVTWWGTNPTLQ
ncbi:MAG: DUF4249 family protein [Bacteroidales bacterium]|nr:DUF4249 family protein [Bacteroidales bacterium]